jgi:hypothetical protein
MCEALGPRAVQVRRKKYADIHARLGGGTYATEGHGGRREGNSASHAGKTEDNCAHGEWRIGMEWGLVFFKAPFLVLYMSGLLRRRRRRSRISEVRRRINSDLDTRILRLYTGSLVIATATPSLCYYSLTHEHRSIGYRNHKPQRLADSAIITIGTPSFWLIPSRDQTSTCI